MATSLTTDCAAVEPLTTTIAVLSDIHAFDQDENSRPSWVFTGAPQNDVERHPLASLLAMFEQRRLRADLVVCPGDLGDRARRAGIQHGWEWLHKLAAGLRTSRIIATPGNHDMDSRHLDDDPDPKGPLMALVPPFPFATAELNDKFWTRHYFINDSPLGRVVSLNTSAYHGMLPANNDNGSISVQTLQALDGELRQQGPRFLNILVCHHHPQQHMELQLGDYDVMQNGQLLLDLLGEGRYGEWIIIHGHKHHPKLTYAAGGASSPVVFSAGSVSAKLYPELATAARNQFYLITLSHGNLEARGLSGTVQTWEWAYGHGWRTAPLESNLPGRCGFGFRGSLPALARRVALSVTEPLVRWDRISNQFSEIAYVLPNDLTLLCDVLLPAHGVTVTRTAEGAILELGRTL